MSIGQMRTGRTLLGWLSSGHTPLGVGGRCVPWLAGQDCARGVHCTPIPSRCGRAAGGRQGRYDSGCFPSRRRTTLRHTCPCSGSKRGERCTQSARCAGTPKSVGPVSDCTRTSAIKLDEGEPTCSFCGDVVLAVLVLSLAWLALCSSLPALPFLDWFDGSLCNLRVTHRRVILAGLARALVIIALDAHVPVLSVVGFRVLLSSKSPCDPLKIFHTVVAHILYGSISPDVLAIASEPQNMASADSGSSSNTGRDRISTSVWQRGNAHTGTDRGRCPHASRRTSSCGTHLVK
ncbi:hypothetical protein C8R46DRAFT_1121526 [Mycena filopes]|nr:hypothetical protein C8R46DRAFT_1121526 [Mycena filopes]